MISSVELLDAMKAHQGWTDYRVHKELEMSQGGISNIRTGRGEFSDEKAVQAAVYADLDPAWVLASLKAWKERNKPTAPLWEQIADQMRAA